MKTGWDSIIMWNKWKVLNSITSQNVSYGSFKADIGSGMEI